MTKLSISALTMALLIRRSDAACPSEISLGATCDLAALESAISGVAECTIDTLFPDGDAEEAVEELCEYDAPHQFVEIQGTYQLDRRYFNGGGNIKDGENTFDLDVARVKRFITNEMNNQIISWPEYAQREDYNEDNDYGVNGYINNFNIDPDAEKGSCQMNTAMCCFVENVDSDAFVDNSDSCRHDLSTSPQSNHIKSGAWSMYSGNEPTHCVGFTWKEGDASDMYKGNSLFYASLFQTTTEGYMGNIPGAPMCACVEQMPVVTAADCVEATGVGLSYTFTIDAAGDISASHEVTMSYGACANDLSAQVKSLHAGTDIATDIDDYLVGGAGETCDTSNEEYLNEKQLLLPTGDNPFKDLDGEEYEGRTWKQLFGEGIYFLLPDYDAEAADAEVRADLEACLEPLGRYCMILRKCTSCTVDSHKEIVYQRLTEFNPFAKGGSTSSTVDIPELFMNKWRKPNNIMHVDYELYSSVGEADAETGQWEKSDYNSNNSNYGFPRNSGPTNAIYNQWNSYKSGGGHANHHGFYIEVPTTP